MNLIDKELNRVFEHYDEDNPTPEQIEHLMSQAESCFDAEREEQYVRQMEDQDYETEGERS